MGQIWNLPIHGWIWNPWADIGRIWNPPLRPCVGVLVIGIVVYWCIENGDIHDKYVKREDLSFPAPSQDFLVNSDQ